MLNIKENFYSKLESIEVWNYFTIRTNLKKMEQLKLER